jgi:hypothetical protein
MRLVVARDVWPTCTFAHNAAPNLVRGTSRHGKMACALDNIGRSHMNFQSLCTKRYFLKFETWVQGSFATSRTDI